MRELKFRGKLLKDSDSFKTYKKGTIIEGGFCYQGSKTFIVAHFNVFEVEQESVSQYTGFKDKNKDKIFKGDNLTDVVETDEGKVNSKQKVFWNAPTGSWHLDNSFEQDETNSTELWLELNDFQYEILTK